MEGTFESFFRLLPARLSRRIVFWVFVSVILIEAIIFIPSLRNRERELLDQLRDISLAKVGVLMQVVDANTTDEVFLEKARVLLAHPAIVGIGLYRMDGTPVGVVGEPPASSHREALRRHEDVAVYDRAGERYEVAYTGRWERRHNLLVVRHDAASVARERNAFIFRILGLVIVISAFVAVGAFLALSPIVVSPILRLREDLVAAGEAVSRDRGPPELRSVPDGRNDELGEVVGAFRKMLGQIVDAITRRKAAELALKNSLHQVETYSRALNRELEKGREIQKNFLPRRLPQSPGWEAAAFFKPARQVAGDFYDLFPLSDRHVGLVVADVCDKGVGAALFMALFRSLIRLFSGQYRFGSGECPVEGLCADDGGSGEGAAVPAEALRAVLHTNRFVARNHGDLGMFATVFFGVLDTRSGELTYINAGHDPLIVVGRDGGVRARLRPTGPSVGVAPEARFVEASAHIAEGETLLGYTDGVTEAASPEGGFFEFRRLEAVLAVPAPSARSLVDTIAADVGRHTGNGEQFDDITILAVRRTAGSARGGVTRSGIAGTAPGR